MYNKGVLMFAVKIFIPYSLGTPNGIGIGRNIISTQISLMGVNF